MFRCLRFILLFVLALPAAQLGAHPAPGDPAPVHDMAMMTHDMAGHHDMGGSAPASPPAVHHDCIGCIAPIDIGVYRPASAPHLLTRTAEHPANAQFLLAPNRAPEPPPPRPLA